MATAKNASIAVMDLKIFLPARDFDLSKRFYRAIGFNEDWTNGEVACFKAGNTSFMLRAEEDADYAKGVQMQLVVGSVDKVHEDIEAALKPFGMGAPAPVDRPWGARDFVLTDPSGVRWRITQVR